MLALYKNSFLSNLNTVYDAKDYRGQMAASALLRILSHYYLKRECRNGPFYLQITDSHGGNLFIDDNLNVTLIDLE
jgi:hypothetical protein